MRLQSLRVGVIISYITTSFSIISGLVYTPYLIRTLGLSDYAIYILVFSVISYFSVDFGLGAFQTRNISRLIAEGKKKEIPNLLGVTTKLYLLIDVVLLLLLLPIYFFSDRIFTELTPLELSKFKAVFVYCVFYIICCFPLLPLDGIFIAYKKYALSNIIELTYRVLNFVLLISVLFYGFGLYSVVCVSVLVNIFFRLVRLSYVISKLKLRINLLYFDKSLLKTIWDFSSWATIGVIADKFFFAIIPMLMSAFTTTREVAFFAIVISIEGYVLSISRAMNNAFIPQIMSLIVTDAPSEAYHNLLVKVGRINLYVVGFIITGLFSFGFEFLKFWLGEGFSTSYYAMVIVLLPCLFHLTQNIAEELIIAHNKMKFRAIVNIVGSVLSVLFIVILSPVYGAIGVAISVAISFILAHNVLADIFYKRLFNINILSYFQNCHFRILPIYILMFLLAVLINNIVSSQNIAVFLLKVVVWSLLTSLLLWKYSFNTDEKNYVEKIIKMK
ncbi:polysaccharide biosynthesis C-terminal domain-containing protein [Bacteroides fragilis]|uniref:polysaccharide biosynthesis C-terminal domain-containing protein n=1 Tax=Bacteroides fragilis TaxID=817 RepID=UPI0022AB284A|nr:polysaccharide biosynthesis C-terminal domain-containing protein [Bacteroides fragilis]MCZ2614368.1 polysaccharide biosynthesis C-terminal domain-containing protein [Bacteroides fragilis]MCZ2625159.1 polysaccharide biosynthesis C-terminal domain-containing protein [Bacteroides fragilis]